MSPEMCHIPSALNVGHNLKVLSCVSCSQNEENGLMDPSDATKRREEKEKESEYWT